MRAKLTRDRHEDRRIWRGNRRERYGLLLLLIRSPAKWFLVVSLAVGSSKEGPRFVLRGWGGMAEGLYSVLTHFVNGAPCPPKFRKFTICIMGCFDLILIRHYLVCGLKR